MTPTVANPQSHIDTCPIMIFDLVKGCFEEEESNIILGIPTSLEGCNDRIIWHHTSNGDYTVRTGYGIAMDMQEKGVLGRKGIGGCSRRDEPDKRWMEIWRLEVPNKMKFFIWRSCRSALAVRGNLHRRRMRVNTDCVLCGDARETEHHLFFECEFSRVLWFSCPLQLDITSASGRDFGDCWHSLCNRFRKEKNHALILQECVFIMWRIWKCRNDLLFKGMEANPMESVNVVRYQIMEYRAAHDPAKMSTAVGVMGEAATYAGQPVRWKRPKFGVIKINCDGAWCASTLRGGYGWVMRDFAGMLLAAGGEGGLFFNKAAMAEASAVRAALRVCRERGLTEVEIESDSQGLISMINGAYVVDATLEGLIYDIRALASQVGRVSFVFVKRKGNAAAHAVVVHVTQMRGDFCWDAHGPEFLFNILAKDVNVPIRI